ncbi:MarR family transcriptional regulator [Salmonella enterica]|nr:MarR family transcriptional regulator [Salmonella enterica]
MDSVIYRSAFNRFMGLSGGDRAVLDVLLGHITAGNKLDITQQEIATVSGMTQPSVCRAIKRLRGREIILMGSKKNYYLNPEIGYSL